MHRTLCRILCWLACWTLLITFSAATSAQEVTLEVWLTSGADQVNEMLPEFYERHPHIKVNVSPLSWTTYNDQVLLAFATQSAPDVLMGGSATLWQLVHENLGLPLNPYTDRWGELDDFAPGALEAMTYRGTLYGLPLMAPSRAMWYRKDLFAEHGLDPDDPPTTWEGIRDAARRIVRYNGDQVTRIGISLSSDIVVHAFLTNGVRWFADDLRSAAFNTPEGLEALTFWSEFAREMRYLGRQLALPAGGLVGGAAGMVYGYVQPGQVTQADPALLDQVGGPVVMERRVKAAHTYPDWVFITSQTRHPDEAWEFVKWLTEPYNLVRVMQGVHPSPRRSSYEHPYFDTPEGSMVRRHFTEATLPYGRAFELWPDYLNTRVYMNVWEPLVNQTLSPQAAMQRMETEMNAALANLFGTN